MSLAFIAPGKTRETWIQSLKALASEINVQMYPDIKRPDLIIGAILWRYPYGILKEFKNLRWVSSLGAGVDYILKDPELPPGLIITRIVDRHLNRDMKRTALLAVLTLENKTIEYRLQQKQLLWKPLERTNLRTIGILGLGEMGRNISEGLLELGYRIKGFSLSEKNIDGVESYYGTEVPDEFLHDLDLLISVLPLTESTENILNKSLFLRMKKGAFLVNLGRGNHLVEEDLIENINQGQLGGAWLDVFRVEPLPPGHPFWQMEKIIISPHIASITDPTTASEIIVENYLRLKRGDKLLYEVNSDKGY